MLACAFHPELTDDPGCTRFSWQWQPARGGVHVRRRRRERPQGERLAKILVGYSTKVKEGETVAIDGEAGAEPLLLAIYEEVLKAGRTRCSTFRSNGQTASYFKHASDAQLDWVSPVAEWMVENVDVRIAVGASDNTRELSAVPPSARPAASGDGELMPRR